MKHIRVAGRKYVLSNHPIRRLQERFGAADFVAYAKSALSAAHRPTKRERKILGRKHNLAGMLVSGRAVFVTRACADTGMLLVVTVLRLKNG